MIDARATFLAASQSASDTGLPPVLVERARARLLWVAQILGVLTLVAMTLWPLGISDVRGMPIHIAVLAVSAGLYFTVRSPRISDARALDIGLVGQVAYSATIAFPSALLNLSVNGALQEMTWVCITIVVFPLLVPSQPPKILAASIASALTAPAAALFASAQLDVALPVADVVGICVSPSFCVVLAYFGAKLVYGLGVDVARAQRMGSYQLDERLGRGGMGEVWRAEHRLLARPAAVKLIRRESLASNAGTAVQRFEREAQVTARLKSPHTVELYDFGVTEEGTLYYVMELLDGVDLESMVREAGPLSPARTLKLLGQMCHSLHEAHEAGLVHRDVKPGNIIVGRYGLDEDFVKVLDFGLVSLALPDGERARLTDETRVVGTPAYLAPEMVTQVDVDRRVDIYALGCVAYWLLTGRLVFEADTPMATVLAHATQTPAAPSTHRSGAWPEALDALVLRCLEKDPGARPATAAALADALAAIPLGGAPPSSSASG